MPSWTFTGSRVSGTTSPVTLFGVAIPMPQAKARYGGEITRHHIIDIQLLQRFWNTAVAREDDDTMTALATWAGAAVLLPGRPFNMQSTAAPRGLLGKIAWNPFNLIVGPSTNVRVGDPGSDFDRFEFRSFPKFSPGDSTNKAESLARQEFNTHFYRLRQLYLRMKEYAETPLAHLASQSIDNVRMLLVSDMPGRYPALHGGVGINGSLLHPDLWQDYTLVPWHSFAAPSDAKKLGNVTARGSAPYASVSYFTDSTARPVDQFASVYEDAKGAPTSPPALTLTTADRGLFDRATCTSVLEAKLQPVRRFATGGGLRLFVCGPSESGLFRDVRAAVAEAVRELVCTRGYRMTYSTLVRADVPSIEVRVYMK